MVLILVRLFHIFEPKKLIDRGCLAFFAFIHDTIAKPTSMYSISIVCEFWIYILSIYRESLQIGILSFAIDLELCIKPISSTPHHMALAELKEIKEQLQDLLIKGFIHPSILSWGASILFMKKKDGSIRICIDYQQ